MKYYSGIEARDGDIIAVSSQGKRIEGRLLLIVQPNTADSETWSLPNGGVLIEGGGLGLFVVSSLEDDEDVEFVRRVEEDSI